MKRIAVARRFSLAAIVIAALTTAVAQTADEGDDDEDDEDAPVEEITVIANKGGDPRELEAKYEELLRARILREYRLEQQRQEDEFDWRQDRDIENTSRIRWGYDPEAEFRMRQETALMDLQWAEKTRPASIIRIEF